MGIPLERITASRLWPQAADGDDIPGFVPKLPEHDEVPWLLLDPEFEDSLKAQLDRLLSQYGHVVPDNVPASVSIDDSIGPVCIDDRAIVGEGVRLEGPCYVGPGAEIRHSAYVRPYTWVCSSAVIGHSSEVKHSLLLPGAKAPHFNYVGDSVLGRDANLGAGCKISNLRNDGREVIVRGLEGGDLESGLRKFGALVGDGCALGCNSVTNPGVILGREVNVWPNITVSGVHAENSIIKE